MTSATPGRIGVSMELLEPAGLLAIVEAQAGDRAGLEFVLRCLQGPLHRHALFILEDETAADDVLQDALVSVARSIRQLRDPRFVYAWAYRIVHRAATRELRRIRAAPSEVELDRAIDPAAPEVAGESLDPALLENLERMIAELPMACGSAIRLRYLQELSLAEVAAVLDVPVGTVKSRLNYGLGLLRQRLAPP